MNKKGEPAEVAKNIIESAWEMNDRHFVKGILTNCNDGKESEISLEYLIKPSTSDSSRKVFTLLNGVTGYENFIITEHTIDYTSKCGWSAVGCMEGSKKLFIPAEEMRKAFMDAGLLRRFY